MIHLPTIETIESWSSLNDVEFLDTAPRAVPPADLLTYPVEGNFDYTIYSQIKLPASKILENVKLINDTNEKLNKYLNEIYTKRPLAPPIEQNITFKDIVNNPLGYDIVFKSFSELIEFLYSLRVGVEEAVNTICNQFSDNDLWVEGQYSSTLIESIIDLIHNILAIGALVPLKKYFSNDLSFYYKICNDESNKDKFPAELHEKTLKQRVFFGKHALFDFLLNSLDNLPCERVKVLFDIFYEYIRNRFKNNDFINYEKRFHYISALKVIYGIYFKKVFHEDQEKEKNKKYKRIIEKLTDDHIDFLNQILKNYTIIPYVFDCAFVTESEIPKEYLQYNGKNPSIKNPIKLTPLSPDELLDKAQQNFEQLSHLITSLSNHPPIPGSQKFNIPVQLSTNLLKLLPSVLQDLSSLISFIRVKYLSMLLECSKMVNGNYSYEQSLKENLTDDLLKRFINIIYINKTTYDLIIQNYALIKQCIADSINDYVQNFLLNTLEKTKTRNADYQELIVNVVESCRTYFGYIEEDSYNQYLRDKKTSKVFSLPVSTNIGDPNTTVLELLRSQMQLLTNKHAKAVTKPSIFKRQPLNGDDEKIINEFLNESQYFIELINLQHSIDKISNQSNLFFKETFLDLSKKSFFGVKESLPFLISQWSMENYQTFNLTASIFYPLSIYDDAAYIALHVLKSQYLYEEIKAEANICVHFLSIEFAEKVFSPILKFSTLRLIPTSNMSTEKDSPSIYEDVKSIRLGIILQQNKLTILGSTIDTKKFIAKRINQIFIEKFMQLMRLLKKHGLHAAHFISRYINILKKAHELITLYDITLIPFDDLLRASFTTDSPDSFQTNFANHILYHLINEVSCNFSVFTYPLRIIPKTYTKFQNEISSIFKNDTIGKVIFKSLPEESKIISVNSFIEMFKFLTDGEIKYIANNLINTLHELTQNFIAAYDSCSNILKRIQNPSMSDTSYQVYNRFKGAYLPFLSEENTMYCIDLMSQIGNILFIAQMLDYSYLAKRLASHQSFSFIFSQDPLKVDDEKTNELTDLLSAQFPYVKDHFSALSLIESDEIIPHYFDQATRIFVDSILPHISLFNEKSTTLCDIQNLTGFASIYSILEFIISISISNKENSSEKDQYYSGIVAYGEGILYTASIILILTKQKRLYRALSIQERILAHKQMDLSKTNDSQIKKYLLVAKYFSTTMSSALSNLEPIISRNHKI